MAKSIAKKSFFSSRLILVGIAALALGGWWLNEKQSLIEDWQNNLLAYVDNSDVLVLQANYTPEQIIQTHQAASGNDLANTVQEPVLKYYPYLLLDVKYTENLKSREGVLLWDMVSGEMILNTVHWEITHGFKDCLDCQASRSDFKIIQALASNQNGMSIESLQKELHIEREVLDLWLENAKSKHLIVQKGSLIQLHFENPKLLVSPQTQFDRQLVTKPAGVIDKVKRIYSRNQILNLAKAAFGEDFKVRREEEVYLPVYNVKMKNSDETTRSVDYNGVTGQIITPYYITNVK